MASNSNSPYQSPQTPLSVDNSGYAPILGLGDWLITIIVMSIPLVNIIMLFVWGFGSGSNPNRANFCKATLIIYVAIIALWLLLFVGMGLSMSNL